MRRRLGVALLLPEPWNNEIKGLRRALGAPSLDTQPPHLTLVPPVNVAEDRLHDAVAVLRRAAARCAEWLDVTIGPPATFAPISPVVYLEVSGDRDAIIALQSDVFAGPLLRRVDYAYVPHVTLSESVADEHVGSALSVLQHYRITARFERVHLLEQGPDRAWRPLTDVAFGPPIVRGRGGVELHLRWSERPAPDAEQLLAWAVPMTPESDAPSADRYLEARDAHDALVGVRVGPSAVVVDEWLGCGIEDRLLDEPLPR